MNTALTVLAAIITNLLCVSILLWLMLAEGDHMLRDLNLKHGEGNYDTQEKRNVHPSDERLRKRGFIIHSRPSVGNVVWSRNGRKYSQEQAEHITKLEEEQN